MSKAVLISIQPHWCALIASGKKMVEVRKSKPKLETPFKCYIYCTKAPKFQFWTGPRYSYADDHSHNAFDRCGNGKVIGEFVCDRVYQYTTANSLDGADISTEEMVKLSCLTEQELSAYEHSAEPKENCIYLIGLYGWHISGLVIYDTPEPLCEFGMKRPPQSWCYVKEEEKAND